MPTYDYECPKCGHRFEKFQSMSDPPVKTCPECRSRRVKRLIGPGAGLLFKGSGFYITDYRDSGYKEAAKKETGAAAGGDAGGSAPAADAGAKKPAPAKESKTPAKKRPKKSGE